MQSRLDTVVAGAMATLLGGAAFFLVGGVMFVSGFWLAPRLVAMLLGAGAVGGGWLAVRGERSAKWFGVGMMVGWGLLAAWTSGMSVVGPCQLTWSGFSCW